MTGTVHDHLKGGAVMAAVEASDRASPWTVWAARFFGLSYRINHLGIEHRLSLWRGTWYHTGAWEVE